MPNPIISGEGFRTNVIEYIDEAINDEWGLDMKFGEKVRLLRSEKKLSQTELGRLCGLSPRTIRNYETDGRYPKQRGVYAKLADVLGCEVNHLLIEDEEYTPHVQQTYAQKGARQIDELVADVSDLFFGGELGQEDKDAIMKALQEAYRVAKEKRKDQYSQTRYQEINKQEAKEYA